LKANEEKSGLSHSGRRKIPPIGKRGKEGGDAKDSKGIACSCEKKRI